jgi:predicted nucleotidyltransferase
MRKGERFMPKTIRDLTQDEIEKYWEALKKREEREKEFLRERFKDAWIMAKKASEILYKKYQAKEVIIFGSLTDFSRFNRWSDIDIAVSGIPSDLYLKAVAEVISLSPDFKIDLLDIEDCKEFLREIIEKEGIKV